MKYCSNDLCGTRCVVGREEIGGNDGLMKLVRQWLKSKKL